MVSEDKMKNTKQVTITLDSATAEWLAERASKMPVPPKLGAFIKHIVDAYVLREKRKGDK